MERESVKVLILDCLLPRWVMTELARSMPSEDHPIVEPDEAHWIEQLAGGSTVATLAGEVGYSEREMFRLLHALYERMGAKDRSEALILAIRWGLISPS